MTMEWKEANRIARRRLGIATFERDCRCTMEQGQRKKAWRVPGTREAGTHATLSRMVSDETARLMNGEPGIFGKEVKA